MDYFTKWTEAEPLATITSKKILDFEVKNIICRFGLPRKIVSDNGTQFDSDMFTEFCMRHGITKSFSPVAHPQANGQVEALNKTIKDTLKKRLEQSQRSLAKITSGGPVVTSNDDTNGDRAYTILFGIWV